jgi:hypothetical protein
MAESGIGCRPFYLVSIPTGILKLIESLCNFLGVILCATGSTDAGGSGNKGFFLFVSILALIITFLLLVLGVLNVQKTYWPSRWPFIEFCWCAFIALFYFIASIVLAAVAKYNGVWGGATFFGFAAFITYVADALFQFREFRNNSFDQQNAQQYAPNSANQQYLPSQTNPANQQYPIPTRPQGTY